MATLAPSYCDQCGQAVRAQAKFCPYCGASFIKGIPPAPDTQGSTTDSPPIRAAQQSGWQGTPIRGQATGGRAPALSLGDLPGGVLAAGLLYILDALLVLLLGGIQVLVALGTAAGGDSTSAVALLAVGGWNGVLGAFFCVVGYWILRLKRLGYDWGLGSSVLNVLLLPFLILYNLISGAFLPMAFQLLLFPLAVVMALLLYTNRVHFPAKHPSPVARFP